MSKVLLWVAIVAGALVVAGGVAFFVMQNNAKTPATGAKTINPLTIIPPENLFIN